MYMYIYVYVYIYINGIVLVCEIQKSAQWHIDRAKRIVIKMPQKLTTTACFIQEESSGGLKIPLG